MLKEIMFNQIFTGSNSSLRSLCPRASRAERWQGCVRSCSLCLISRRLFKHVFVMPHLPSHVYLDHPVNPNRSTPKGCRRVDNYIAPTCILYLQFVFRLRTATQVFSRRYAENDGCMLAKSHKHINKNGK